MAVSFPSRRYLTFGELVSRWSCSEREIRAAIVDGQLVPSIFVDSAEMPGQWTVLDDDYENMLLLPMAEERLKPGFLFLRLPHEDGVLSCNFAFVCDQARGRLSGKTAGWWLQIERTPLGAVEENGVFMLEEVERFETAHGNRASAAVGRRSHWPWGEHTTTNLEHLAAAAAQWWERYTPDDNTTAPTNETVSAWLIEKRGVSERLAQAMASILRLDNLPTGPRTESSTPRNR